MKTVNDYEGCDRIEKHPRIKGDKIRIWKNVYRMVKDNKNYWVFECMRGYSNLRREEVKKC